MATVVCGSLVSIAPVVSICMAVRPVHRPEVVGASEVLVIAPLDAGSANQAHKGLPINTGSNRSLGALPAAAAHVIVVFGAMGVGVKRARGRARQHLVSIAPDRLTGAKLEERWELEVRRG
jgi:hypothetical protein